MQAKASRRTHSYTSHLARFSAPGSYAILPPFTIRRSQHPQGYPVAARLFHKRLLFGMLAALVGAGLFAFYAPAPAAAPPLPPTAVALAAARDTDTPTASTLPTNTARPPSPTTTAVPTNTPVPPTATPSAIPTPSPRPAGSVARVGIQAGHWKASELPDELARLRTSSGAHAAGYAEADVNLDVAQRVAALLTSHGLAVDLLPATIPSSYDADVFVSIHADGSANAGARGFKLATPWRTSRASQLLLESVEAEYGAATGLPEDGAITINMRGYYAFNYRRHEHSIARTTPAIIIEMGFLTNAADRALFIGQADRAAVGIANGIVRYLNTRDPSDGAALLPPEYKTQRALDVAGADVRAAPNDTAKVLKHLDARGRFFVFAERNGWYQGFVRGEWRMIGWVRKDQVTDTNDPLPTPPPSTDS